MDIKIKTTEELKQHLPLLYQDLVDNIDNHKHYYINNPEYFSKFKKGINVSLNGLLHWSKCKQKHEFWSRLVGGTDITKPPYVQYTNNIKIHDLWI
jgi:hypothetical protein